MNKKSVGALVAVMGIAVGCAPLSQTPASPATAAGQPSHGAAGLFAGIKKSDQTVAEVYARQNELLGAVVNVRGKVVKSNSQIMGRNWVHIQDGTGASGTNDLTATTADTAKIGDIVLVSGKITQNKDFGGGYKYALIIEDAKVTVEAK